MKSTKIVWLAFLFTPLLYIALGTLINQGVIAYDAFPLEGSTDGSMLLYILFGSGLFSIPLSIVVPKHMKVSPSTPLESAEAIRFFVKLAILEAMGVFGLIAYLSTGVLWPLYVLGVLSFVGMTMAYPKPKAL